MRRFVGLLLTRSGLSLLVLTTICLPTAFGQDKKGKKDASPLVVRCDRDDAIYKVGDKVEFYITSNVTGEGSCRLSNDGVGNLFEKSMAFEAGKSYKIPGSLDKPGFLQIAVTQGKTKVLAAAAFDPTKIEPTAKMPADFDAFWQAGLKDLAKVPMDAQLEKSTKHSTDLVTCYTITLANIEGKHVHGWLSVPVGKGPFPAILTVPGAGVSGTNPEMHYAMMGALSMNIIIHDLPVDETPAFYKKQSAGALKNYYHMGSDDKNKNYYRAVILGCVRCLDYLTSRPDYNGKDLAVTGGSQGGALTLITSGLDQRVTLAAPDVAAMCDHSGQAFGRVSGWPKWLNQAPKEKFDAVLEASAYYDAVNFARKFKGKSVHGVGFIDTTCAPTTVYAAFNVYPEPKVMISSPLLGHVADQRWRDARDNFWKENMKLVPPTPQK